MQRSDLEILEAQLMDEVVRRRHLGGYSTDAESILKLTEAMYRIVGHLINTCPCQTKKEKKDAVSKVHPKTKSSTNERG